MGLQLINTGIDGLDKLLGGGIPKGSTVLISGPPGAGKTVMSLEYTFKRAKKGERVLFVSTCELLYNINRFASSLAFFDLNLVRIGINLDYYGPKEEGGFVEFWDYSLGPVMDEQFAGDIYEVIQEKVSLHKIDHLVIDPISSINMFMGDEAEKRKKLLLFMGWASRSGCTTILTAESEYPSGMERYLADGIIDLRRNKDGLRTAEVPKLRGQRHMSGSYVYTIEQDGAHILAPGLSERAPEKAALTGIADLDANIGGMAYGSAWHFNVSDAPADRIIKEALLRGSAVSEDLTVYISAPDECLCADIPEDRIMFLSPDTPVADSIRQACKDRHCRIMGAMPDKAYAEVLDCIKARGDILVTLSGPDSDARQRESAERSSDGVVDIWNSSGYTMLRVKKAPYAQSFEPFIMKLQDGQIKLIPI
jgi:circadian clock protein KaiC